jgi:hypothetical protein
MSLLMVSTPGHPEREAKTLGALAEQRFLALDVLEKLQAQERSIGHEAAERTVRAAAAERRPYGLYLRNFVLGARLMPGGDDRFGVPQTVTASSAMDARMQTLLAERAGDVPFVAIANRAGDMGVLPRFELSNEDWEAAAGTLIAHAGVVVLFFLTRTPGVTHEIDVLRSAGAQARTLVVVADVDPRDEPLDRATRALFQVAEPSAAPAGQPVRSPPDDFPHQVHVGGDSSSLEDAVQAAIDDLVRRACPSALSELPPFPHADRPGPDALAAAHRQAVAEFEAGMSAFERGDGVAAEDAAMRSIAFSHWARDPVGRAMALMLLGSAERTLLHYPNEAVDAYFLAMDLFEWLQESSETARTVLPRLVDELAAYLDELGDPRRAELVRNRLAKVVGAPPSV